MDPFLTHRGKIAVVPDDNVDTDRIIPARFLSRVSKLGYGELLFSDVRDQNFPLDQDVAKGATVLVVGINFGCGSSREHAVWTIQQAGFKAVVAHKTSDAPGYSDIFRQNSANCGLLLVELDTQAHSALVAAGSGAEVEINLVDQTVEVGQNTFGFQINEGTKQALIAGLDLIGTTLQYAEEITEFETNHESYVTR